MSNPIGSSVDLPAEPMTSESTSATPGSDPPSSEKEKKSRCSPHSEETDGTRARTTEQISQSHYDTISAREDISDQSKTPDTRKVGGLQLFLLKNQS